jgi:protein-S-isoprenylcysteine O-methyltransferase Ste14
MSDFLKYFLPTYLILYFGAAFVWRTVLVWKRTGLNPYTLGHTDTAHDLVGGLFRLTLGLMAAVILIYSISSEWYVVLTPILWLQHPALVVAGLILLGVSLVWTLIAQAQMGQAWRIGIDMQHQTELVQSGVFGLSRNPIFLGMRVTLLGLFLILPNALTLTMLALGEALMQIQVRLEEEHLSHLHGERYQAYRQRVRRWL